MSRATLGAVVLAVGVALVAGCGPEKEIPREVTITTGRDAPAALPAPKASEPAARAIVDRCLKDSTQGHPERIEKLKAHRTALKGSVLRPGAVAGQSGYFAWVRKIDAVWPDRFRVVNEFNEGGPTTIAFGVRKGEAWMSKKQGGAAFSNEVPANVEVAKLAEVFQAEFVAREWMALLVPLADPATVVYGAKTEAIGPKRPNVIKAAVRNCPVFTLWFDESTGYLGRVEFDQTEIFGQQKHKVFGFADHKLVDGVFLPTVVNYAENGLDVESWGVDSWQPVDNLDEAATDPPK